ncbi:hydrolase [Thalassobellus suaedae]|uniref:Hydrolase n=1 Tax=Thalassobellus suaedae TaxID=3074124 RepID=A0ABY9Y283_9FLAO|nr:hydrolase [Flavobacteriaceae bacterium HL-DH10]
MKKKIFMYLFVFSILLVLFQYVNAKRVFEGMDRKLEGYKNLSEKYKDSVLVLQNDIADLSHFSLENNEDAISYFENDGYNVSQLIPIIKDALYELNTVKEEEHPVVPYASSEGRKMLINTVKLLNHKWIIADFSDGEFWGEVLLRYYVNEDKTVDFELSESFLYPLQ